MKIMKFGGSCLKNEEDLELVAKIIGQEKDEKVVVLSGINRVTDKLVNFLQKSYSEKEVDSLIAQVRHMHMDLLTKSVESKEIYEQAKVKIESRLKVLERLLYGIHYVGELTEKTRDLVLSYGERLSVVILEAVLRSRGIDAESLEADEIGVVTDGNFGSATADLPLVERNLQESVLPLIRRGIIPVITGFFGRDAHGSTTIFGRNGSDYSASVIGYALNADSVEIWKDVDGFMSADPKFVKNAHLLDELSYDEAAELAYFGARILHPRTVEPLKLKGIPLRIKNMYRRELPGTLVHGRKKVLENKVVKSVTYKDIGALKIYGSGVGSMMGVLGEISTHLSDNRINIKSVITSQTCITLLLEKEDVEKSYRVLSSTRIKSVEKLEKVKDISLIAIVGEGILNSPGIAAKVFNAVANRGINVEMFAAGASEVAFYFIVKKRYLGDAVKAIHRIFFQRGRHHGKA